MRALLLLVIVACSSPAPRPTIENRKPVTTTQPATSELRATVRIDEKPGGKNFRGVWLEVATDKRYVIDYQPRWLWTGFDNHDVIVTGQCYQPFGQAIRATHFRVDRMRFATPPTVSVPLFEIGPEVVMSGGFIDHPAPAGSKLAGSSELRFHHDDGTSYALAGYDSPPSAGRARIKARVVEVNMAHDAQTGGPQIWVARVLGDSDEPHRDTPMPCP